MHIDSILKKEISKRLREIQHNQKLTRKKIADDLDEREATLTAWLNGQSVPQTRFLLNFSNKYNVDMNWLLLGKEPVEQSDINPEVLKLAQHYIDNKEDFELLLAELDRPIHEKVIAEIIASSKDILNFTRSLFMIRKSEEKRKMGKG